MGRPKAKEEAGREGLKAEIRLKRDEAVGLRDTYSSRALGLLQNKSKTHERYENVRSRVRNNKRIELDLD
jgi:hypothetical protein